MIEHKLKRENGNYTLYKGSDKTYCPKSQLIPEQDPLKLDTVRFTHFPCSTGCPFNTITKLKKQNGNEVDGIILRCMEKPYPIEVEIIKTDTKVKFLKKSSYE